MRPGDRVLIAELGGFNQCLWVPTGAAYDGRYGPAERLTGTIQRVFKNGSAAVAVDQIPNRSADGLKTLHFPVSALRELAAA